MPTGLNNCIFIFIRNADKLKALYLKAEIFIKRDDKNSRCYKSLSAPE